MKCCANCLWCTASVKEVKEELKQDIPFKPAKSTCALGCKPNEEFYCKEHNIVNKLEYKTRVLYDEKYMGPGYFIVTEFAGEVIRFMKISAYGVGGFPTYFIHAYEKGSVDTPDVPYRKIEISVRKDHPLYNVIVKLDRTLNNHVVMSQDKISHGDNNFQAKSDENTASLIFTKDVYGVKHATGSIEILAGDSNTCESYLQIAEFYNFLSSISMGKLEEKTLKRILNSKK